MKDLTLEYLKDIPIIDVAERTGHAGLMNFKKSGDGFIGDCFDGIGTAKGAGGHECFKVYTATNSFYCWHCNRGGSVVDFAMRAQELEFLPACEWLAESFSRSDLLDDIKKTSEATAAQRPALEYKKSMFYEALYEYGRQLLFQERGAEVRAYLNGRGYNNDQLKNMEWIFWPSVGEARIHLCEKFPKMSAELIAYVTGKDPENCLPLCGHLGDVFRLAIPYRNIRGDITGIVFRDHTGALNPKYSGTHGLDKRYLFNLNKCRGQKSLVIVEGYPDAAYFGALGMNNVVAVGMGKLSEAHLLGLELAGVRSVTIAFDNDPKPDGSWPGRDNTIAAIKLLMTKTNIDVFVIEPKLYADKKDPDEYVKEFGLERFKTLVDGARNAAEWLAVIITRGRDKTNDKARIEAIREAADLSSEWPSTREEFYKLPMDIVLAEWAGYSAEALVNDRHRIEEEKKAANLKAITESEISDLTRRAQDLLAAGYTDKAIELLKEKAAGLDAEKRQLNKKISKDFSQFLWEKYNFDLTRGPGPLGFPLTRFKNLCNQTDGIQPGFYIIGAHENIGKTGLEINIALDLVETNPEVACLFYTLDDCSRVFVNRFIGAIIGDVRMNDIQRPKCIDASLYPGAVDDMQAKILNAYKKLDELYKAGRFILKDQDDIKDITDIERDIVKAQESGKKVVVAIDAVFNLSVGATASKGGMREDNIDRAQKLKSLVDRYDIPLFCTVEVRKVSSDNRKNNIRPTPDDIMETGKYKYNANLIWILYNKIDDCRDTIREIIVDCAKNKLHHDKGYNAITFNTSTGAMKDSERDLKSETPPAQVDKKKPSKRS